METWWWLALGAVVVLSLVAALVDGGARTGRPFFRPRGGGSRRTGVPLPDRGPRAGEIWWTREPLLVLVLAVRIDGARVVRVSAERPYGEGESRTPETPGATLALPPGTVPDAPGRVTALRTGDAWEVPLRDFRRRAGEVDRETWAQVRHFCGEE
ncbi:hypothetical protein K378_00873 [Streptomyces sp. Amel2xB2]|uniref:type II toxin-antitoxin system PemK/MazF family toxin n=1 Tax=Streptomyces sp. Amel2xB2 TaxID=1305829 RepID=UPI000DB97F87|nr:type II toxin-antitoxin system PemK/MazF family toxin [Streptomyces sp. Amel2xB2]RAJ69721.1 hypothetical protein K378_00873 [Streptomyces sp. Amel2xB2]